MSSRDIAADLTASVGAVKGHIYRACVKLDAAD
ncbi:DNA-directed RNA polymerase specialized sigma24 family protein [Mycolicibacterium sp. BK634]|nr:sigma-70 region 4 domain-containing protein [Mycolicibacterium sp. BK634]MBB3753801.1 DNA-directed RNA polymerase specialized sigma24 family protein [Mycolicibacterium sp. BK634]